MAVSRASAIIAPAMPDATPTTAARGASAGFTLIELLVALTLFGLIAAALAGGLRFGVRAWEAQDRIVRVAGDLDPIEGMLRQLLSGARGVHGDAEALTMVGAMPASFNLQGLYDLQLSVTDDRRLVLRWRYRGLPGDVRATSFDELELARGIVGLELAYLPRGRTDWTSRWTGAVTPALVRLRLVLSSGDPRRAPELVAAPQVEAPYRF